MTDNKYNWIAFYSEFADALVRFKENRVGLIEIIKSVFNNTGISMPKLETDYRLIDVDPFTVFGLFNKGITEKNRKAIIGEFKKLLSLNSSIPDTFDGIPILYNQNATFYKFIADGRGEHDIDNL